VVRPRDINNQPHEIELTEFNRPPPEPSAQPKPPVTPSWQARDLNELRSLPKTKSLLYNAPARTEVYRQHIAAIQDQLNAISDSQPDPHLAHLQAMESLSKLMAYQNIEDVFPPGGPKKLTFKISIVDAQGKKKIVEYELDKSVEFGGLFGSIGRFFGLSSGGIKARMFKAKNDDGPGLVLYHGTRKKAHVENAAENVLLDTDPRGIGRALLNWRGNKLNSEIGDWIAAQKQGVITTGHSLGGTLANLTAVYAPDKVKSAITFNAPGLHKDAYAEWQRLKATRGESNMPDVVGFGTQGDPIPELGWRKIGREYQFKNSRFPVDVGEAHSSPRLLRSNFEGLVGEDPADAHQLGDFKTRLERLQKTAELDVNHFNQTQSKFLSKSTLQRIVTPLLSLLLGTGTFVKRLLIGHEGANFMRYGLLGFLPRLPFAIRELLQKRSGNP
jgi:pimeloyl-ACP methyl ester carboxylesterase